MSNSFDQDGISSAPPSDSTPIVTYKWMSDSLYFSALALSYVSCVLSVAGSSTIIYLVFRRPHVLTNEQQIYHRIMLGLSVMDITTTLGLMVSPFFNRAETDLPLAMGNAATCTASAFFASFFIGSCLYNCLLSLFYVLTVRRGVPQQVLARRCEPWMHIIAFGFPIGQAIVGAATEVFNPSQLINICLAAIYPWNCFLDTIECE